MAENTPSNFLSPDEQEALDMICQDLEHVIEEDYAAEPAEPPLYARQTGIGQWEGADHPSGPWRKVLPADLARWGNPEPAPPADGEVAELVEKLNDLAYDVSPDCATLLRRTAELLQRQALVPEAIPHDSWLPRAKLVYWHQLPKWPAHALQRQALVPVPVSERMPGPEDCDAEERCWAGTRASVDSTGDRDIDLPPSWELREVCAQDDVWLPAHALPLPEVAQ